MKSCIVFIFLCTITLIQSTNDTFPHKRSKRSFYLLFPPNAVLQFTYGLTVPLVLPRRSINLSWGVQSQYNLPRHISNLQPSTIKVRENPSASTWGDLSRVTFYEYFSEILDNFGFHGKQCVFRSICEVAEFPMYKREHTILEKIVEFLFTPSLDYYIDANDSWAPKNLAMLPPKYSKSFITKLLLAEKRGKSHGNCEESYSKCLISIIDLITILYVTE